MTFISRSFTVKFSPAFFKRLRGIKGRRPLLCGARCAMRSKSKERSKKRPCQPKTAKRFFGGPDSQGPSGQAKERTRVLPARRDSFAFGARWRRLPGWPFLRGLPLSWCEICAPGARLPAVRFCARSSVFVLAVCLPVLRCLHAHFSLYLSPFPVWLLPLKLLFICRSCRDGHPIFFSERKWGKRTARGAARRSPSNPIPAPCGQSIPFPALLAGLTALWAANRRLTGKTLEKPRSKAQLFKRFCAKDGQPAP